MKQALASLFSSKKAIAAMAGAAASAIILLASKHGYGLDPEATSLLVKGVLGLVGVYVLGTGAADWGKEKAKIEQAAIALLSTAERRPLEPKAEVLTEDA